MILPLVGALLGVLVLPAAVVWGLREFFDLPLGPKFMCKLLLTPFTAQISYPLSAVMHAYPGMFATVGFYRASVSTLRLLSSWSQAIRDKEFLVEMRLQNLEPAASETNHLPARTQAGEKEGRGLGDA